MPQTATINSLTAAFLISGHGGGDAFEERQEFLMPMTCVALRQDLPVGDVEGANSVVVPCRL